MLSINEKGIKEKRELLNIKPQYVKRGEMKYNINADFIYLNTSAECYRELMVSYLPMLPLLEKTVKLEDADYILYMHPYARCQDASEAALSEVKRIAQTRREGAQIIVVGKAANLESLLDGSIKNIIFWGDHFTEKLGEKFGFDIREKYFVYDDELDHLAIWPVDGCLQKCKFCRRCYMDIKFESLSLDIIKKNLDEIRRTNPEKLRKISLRAENLTEYGIDIYGEPSLHKLLHLLDSYEEIEIIEFPIGLSIGEITPEILDSICRLSKKITRINMNLETGSDRLLKLIGKKHTVEDAIQIFNKVQAAHPEAKIDTTVMIGLPTEEIIDMYVLAYLIAKTKPHFVLCNYYIPASKHPLAQLPQLSESLKEYHLKILLNLLWYFLDSELIIEYYAIFKNKSSRKTYRMKERLRKSNEKSIFDEHFIDCVRYGS